MRAPGDRPPTGDRFFVECPACGREAGSYAAATSKATRHCRCGAVFKIDVEARAAGERID